MSFLIGVSGESGVGKSTIADMIQLYLGKGDTTRLSTDDLHKWERTNPTWEKITHLNPSANNLELGDIQIADLAMGKPIYRSTYNHKTGTFDPPTRVEPRKFIINEGLHAFYSDAMNSLIDLKIYVDTNEELRTHWKLLRDTESRGYKYSSVMDAINKRKADRAHVARQRDLADVIIMIGTANKIRYPGYKNEDIVLTVNFEWPREYHRDNPMFAFIEKFMMGLNDFVRMSKSLGRDPEMCQNNGGNVSVKVSDSLMIIKASGHEMKNVHGLNGHVVVDHLDVLRGFSDGSVKDNWSLVRRISDAVPLENRRPSMETGFHARLGKYVAHTHPVYLNVLLCLEGSREIVAGVYGDMDYEYVPYENPGFDVCKKIVNGAARGTYFLENHGLIVSTDSDSDAVRRSIEINQRAKDWLMGNCPNFTSFSMDFAEMRTERQFFYPDSAVFLDNEGVEKKEILAVHNYISVVGGFMGKLRALSPENVSFLQNLESEAYRKSIQ